MMIRLATLRAIADGTVTQAFRRWDTPRVRAGGRQRTALGVIAFDAVEPVKREVLTDADAVAAGFESRDALVSMLDRREHGTIYRVRLRVAGPDPRVRLREQTPGPSELAEITDRLARLDRVSHHGPWTRAVLEAIAEHPGERAVDLAARFGREKLPFKLDVRKLKELGLTESLRPGYRLSPRGRAVRDALREASSPPSDEAGDRGVDQ
jgi:hypothetical protein